MRDVKFRGQTISGEWVYGYFTVLKRRVGDVDAGTYISNDAGLPFAYAVRPETVCESTGLKDKNDNDIYEGDIVVGHGGLTMAVAFYLGAFGHYDRDGQFFPIGRQFLLRWKDDKSQHAEIIGNIYENKELLEER